VHCARRSVARHAARGALLAGGEGHTRRARARRGSAFWGYVGGLGATIAVMNIFQAAQPALLYIVPAVLLAVGVHAQLRGEFRKARALLALLQGPFYACCSSARRRR